MHAVIAFRNIFQSINTIIGNGKRFMPARRNHSGGAYEIIKRLKERNETDLLNQLSSTVEAERKKRKKQHDVWELSFDWKICETAKFITQKLDYFHDNPCKGKWNLCANPADYIHSSAKYYLTGEQGVYEITDYAEVLEMDLKVIQEDGNTDDATSRPTAQG